MTKIFTIPRRRVGVALALVWLAAPAAARADWAWTRWGMSADAVVAASDGRVARVEGAAGQRVNGWDLRATGPVEQDGLRFRAEFFFDPEGQALHVVRLSLIDVGDCGRLEAALRRRHGEPRDQSVSLALGSQAVRVTLLKWDDDGQGDFLALTAMPPVGETAGNCFIRYRPLNEPDPRQ